MKQIEKRYDAWGNPILPREAMLAYYARDPRSVAVLRRLMPHRYIVIPTVEIEIDKDLLPTVIIRIVYPGGSVTNSKDMSDRAINALRHTFSTRKGWLAIRKCANRGILRREGMVIEDCVGKFGWSPSLVGGSYGFITLA